ncbi:heavy metal-associated isoprenylated plant protein 6-like [Punica granatum]|uniref:Heavy metal-associated isoprenylated plant protein 6-like n=1 Tax=Punica granatum TaxID=22663 RepID=A0A6P8CJ31_PUNGR|nr:heavy metal-associated isoprenylated plant protein 6-like [Punica granatum]
MGEKEGSKSEGEKKSGGGSGGDVIVLKMDVHCDGCAKKVKKVVSNFSGVGDVKIDTASNKLTVTGKVDPAKLRQRLEDKTHKRVELVSLQPKKDGGPAGDKKPDEKKGDEKKKAEDKKPVESTAVLKIRLHCDGCMKKIRKVICKIDGVESVAMEQSKDLVTIKGTMDVKTLSPYLQDKFKRAVEVVPPKKDGASKDKSGGGGGDNKGKEPASTEKKADGGGDKTKKEEVKKEVASGGLPPPPKMEISRMEYNGYSTPQRPMYWYDGHGQSDGYPHVAVPYQYQGGHPSQGYYPPMHHIESGYSMDPRVMHAPQMFSDENPNACSVM